MKKTLSFLFITILILQLGLTTNVFADTRQSPFMSKTYTHDPKFNSYTVSHGLDISEYQSSADFVKAKAAGVEFVILRAACRGYGKAGNMFKDKVFDKYATAAINAGLDVGAYIFSQAITVKEAEDEADYLMSIVKGYNLTLPLVFDYEYSGPSTGRLRAAKLSNKQRTNICLAFCKRVEAAGYTAMVYANHSMLLNDLNDDVIAKDYDIWLANYSTAPKYNSKLYQEHYTYWQYTSSGKTKGIPGALDCNFRYFKSPDQVKNTSIVSETLTETKISWGKIKGCYGYQIYKYNNETAQYAYYKTIKGAGITTFTDTENQNMPSKYKIRAISAFRGSFVGGAFSEELATDSLKVNSTTATSSVITWNSYQGATEYEVYRSELSSGNFSLIAAFDASTTSYTDTKQIGFKTYYYYVKVLTKDENGNIIASKDTAVKEVTKKQPILNQAALKTNSKIEVKWTNVAGATGTVIYRKANNGSYKQIATINNSTTASFIDKNIKKGTTYTYQIRQFVNADNRQIFSNYTSQKSATPMKTVSIKATRLRKKVKITYKKVVGASGYEIYMKKPGAKYKRIKSTSKAFYTRKKLRPGTKYSFKVRAYKKVNGKRVYASFSKVKTARPY